MWTLLKPEERSTGILPQHNVDEADYIRTHLPMPTDYGGSVE